MPQPLPQDTVPGPAPTPEGSSGARHRTAPGDDAGFQAFYLATRRRLLLQALAIAGNLSTARHAVRESYIAAHHHWRKVGASSEPEAWVRQRACATAARTSRGNRQIEKTADPEQSTVLAALAALPTPERCVVALVHLGRLPIPVVGRQLAMRPDLAAERLANATRELTDSLGCSPEELRPRLESLAPLVTSPGLPRADAVRRRGVRRRRSHIVGGTALAVALIVGAGWFVSTHAPRASDAVRRAESRPVTTAMLLTGADLSPLGTGWSASPTVRPASACASGRKADATALHTYTRALLNPNGDTAVQVVDVSASKSRTTAAFTTAVRWYAGCAQTGVHLNRAYRLSGVGDQSVLMDLTAPDNARYLVSVTRSDQVTSAVTITTRQTRDAASVLSHLATTTLTRLCPASAVGRCRPDSPRLSDLLPASGETPRMLATVDMPVLPGVTHPWVGTDPVRGGPNLAATTCDRSVLSGNNRPATSRTFLVPQGGLPTRFGLTEVMADYGSAKSAQAFIATVSKRMGSCEKRQLGSSVKQAFKHTSGTTSYAGWRLSNEINAKRSTVSYWMGVVRTGTRVAQIGFAPAGQADIARASFADLLARAGERLGSPN